MLLLCVQELNEAILDALSVERKWIVALVWIEVVPSSDQHHHRKPLHVFIVTISNEVALLCVSATYHQ